jgi:IS605 OrfB family transposase
MAEAIKTIKLKIINPNKGKDEALSKTVDSLNSVLKAYIDLLNKHRDLFYFLKEAINKKTGEIYFRRLTRKEILQLLENLSLPTLMHPQTEINIKSLFPGLPTGMRRSCINKSIGMVRSYLKNLARWEKEKKGKPPSPPSPRNLPTFYSKSYEIELEDFKNQFVRLKVFDGYQWVWKNYPIKIGSKHKELLEDKNGTMKSPTLVPKPFDQTPELRDENKSLQWYLHIPLSKEVLVSPIERQKKENPFFPTLAVDLGLRHLAVVTVRKNGKIVFSKFFRGEKVEGHRLQHLCKVFRKQKKSGKPVRGERSNQNLWRHIKFTNTDITHKITREIVEIAKKFDVKVIILEHLQKFQPSGLGEKRSRKLNRKLTFWLKGLIEKQLRYKAFAEGILVKSVSPAFTSLLCHICGGFGERFSNKSLFRCFYCGYTANADFNASVNLHQVFWEIFPRPHPNKKQVIKKPIRKGKVARIGVC